MATDTRNAIVPLAIAPFEQWTYEDAVREIRERKTADFLIRQMYAKHDHYQKGTEWVGPGIATDTKDDKVKKQFAPEDVVGEVAANVSNAFSEPQVGTAPLITPPEGQAVPQDVQNRMNEANELISNFWDDNFLQEHVQNRQRVGTWAGYAGLRLWVPWRFLQRDGNDITFRPVTKFSKAAEYIRVAAPDPDVGILFTDPGTQDQCAIYLDEEVTWKEGNKTAYKRAELIFLDPNRVDDADAKTIIRIVYEDPNKTGQRVEMALGGRLLFTEMRVPMLWTDPVIRTQRQVNFICSIINRLGETAGFPERYTSNAKPQGSRYLYKDGEVVPNGAYLERDEATGEIFVIVPEIRTLGANTTTELVGLPIYNDKQELTGYATPTITRFDPVDPKPYIEAADAARRRILRMCSQGHLGGISNAEASGIAYEQARAVFEKDLNKRRVSEEGMLRELLTTFLAFIELITGQPGYFTDVVRVTVDQHINPGPRSPDLVRLDLESYEAGALSQPTLMSRIGVEDVNAEVLRVKENAAFILDIIEKAMSSSTAFTPESLIAVMKELNLPETVINLLKPVEAPAPTPTGGTQNES